LSTIWSVNLVTAFGRGETLALALIENGFQVNLLDFTAGLPDSYNRGPGPFPVALEEYHPAQKEFLSHVTPLSHGLSFWLPDGPVELGGPLGEFYASARSDVKTWKSGDVEKEFDQDWIRHFLRQWASPYHSESWQVQKSPEFPSGPAGMLELEAETSLSEFTAYRKSGHAYLACNALNGVNLDGRRLKAIDTEGATFEADQWIWCLSAFETEQVGKVAAQKLFQQNISPPLWVWISLDVKLLRGPWSNGFPEQFVAERLALAVDSFKPSGDA
jgi:hypothetical protein